MDKDFKQLEMSEKICGWCIDAWNIEVNVHVPLTSAFFSIIHTIFFFLYELPLQDQYLFH